MEPAERLRERLAGPGLLVAPGCYDALSAKLVEGAGYLIGYAGGFGASASRIGQPDAGLLSFGEMIDHVTALAAAVSIPMMADADTGYGNEMNVYRTVCAYARAGLAAIQLEDQVWPKRCGHTEGKAVVGEQQALSRLRAACDARAERDIVVIARTDARATLGFEAALDRCRAFAEVGADIVFFEAPESHEEMARIASAIDTPLLANVLEGGRTPTLTAEELESLGYKVAIYPLTLLSVVTAAMQAHLARADAPGEFPTHVGSPSFEELQRIVGFDAYDDQVRRHRG